MKGILCFLILIVGTFLVHRSALLWADQFFETIVNHNANNNMVISVAAEHLTLLGVGCVGVVVFICVAVIINVKSIIESKRAECEKATRSIRSK